MHFAFLEPVKTYILAEGCAFLQGTWTSYFGVWMWQFVGTCARVSTPKPNSIFLKNQEEPHCATLQVLCGSDLLNGLYNSSSEGPITMLCSTMICGHCPLGFARATYKCNCVHTDWHGIHCTFYMGGNHSPCCLPKAAVMYRVPLRLFELCIH